MKKYIKYIIILIIIITLYLGINCLIKYYNQKLEKDFITSANNFTDKYFLKSVSGELLLKNNIISSKYKKFKCANVLGGVITYDCNKADDQVKYPWLATSYYENDELVGYKSTLNSQDTIKLKLFNVGNYEFKGIYYKNELISSEEEIKINNNMQSGTYKYYYNDTNIEFTLNIDNEAPVLIKSEINNNKINVLYTDNNDFTTYYYYAKEKNKDVNEDNFISSEIKFNCYNDINENTYYLYTYAKDISGNKSSITYVGEIKATCRINFNK